MLLNWYVGDGTAHKVKKVYLGVNNKARLVYNPEIATIGGLEKVSNVADLNQARCRISSNASNPNYAIFAGGDEDGRVVYGGTGYNTVEGYNKYLSKSTATSLPTTLSALTGGSIGSYALLLGGKIWPSGAGNTSANLNTYAYDSSLVQSTLTSISSNNNRGLINSNTIGNYCLIMLGTRNSGSNILNYYNKSLTKFNLTLNDTLKPCVGSNNNNYVVYQCQGSQKGIMYTISSSLVQSTISETSIVCSGNMTIGGYALFAGGYDYSLSSRTSSVFGYNNSLVKNTFNSISYQAASYDATLVSSSIKKYAMITVNTVIDVFNENIMKVSSVSLSTARSYIESSYIGDYILFAGGMASNVPYVTVDAWNAKDDSYK